MLLTHQAGNILYDELDGHFTANYLTSIFASLLYILMQYLKLFINNLFIFFKFTNKLKYITNIFTIICYSLTKLEIFYTMNWTAISLLIISLVSLFLFHAILL